MDEKMETPRVELAPEKRVIAPMLLGVIVSEFHVVRGPRVLFAAPEDALPSDWFVRVKEFLIPRPELFGEVVNVGVPGHGLRVLSLAVNIEGEHYPRNNLLFSIAFLFNPRADTGPFRPLLAKLAAFVTGLEKESAFVSRHTNMLVEEGEPVGGGGAASSSGGVQALQASVRETEEPLRALIDSVFVQLRECGSANVTVDDHNSLFLSLDVTIHSLSPKRIKLWDVPLLVAELPPAPILNEWGLALLAVLPFVDGFNHVKRIAHLANMDVGLARAACSALVAAGYAAILDIFKFSNVYTVTPAYDALYEPSSSLMAEARRALAPPGAIPPSRKTVLDLYADMVAPVTLSEFCLSHDLEEARVDILVLVRFGVLHGILRRVHRYVLSLETPVDLESVPDGTLSSVTTTMSPAKAKLASPRETDGDRQGIPQERLAELYALADGTHCYDEVCTLFSVSPDVLDDVFGGDAFVQFLR